MKDKNEWRNFQNEFGILCWVQLFDIFNLNILLFSNFTKDGDRAPYSVGGFITETSGLQHDQLKNLILKSI